MLPVPMTWTQNGLTKCVKMLRAHVLVSFFEANYPGGGVGGYPVAACRSYSAGRPCEGGAIPYPISKVYCRGSSRPSSLVPFLIFSIRLRDDDYAVTSPVDGIS